jgi:hypothetical protein
MKISLAQFRTLPETLPTIPDRKLFNQDDDYQVAWYAQQAGGGGGGGDATAANQVLQIAQETAINSKLANNIAGLPGTYGNMTLANAAPQIGAFVGVFGYTSINTQLASALTGAQTVLIEVSSVTAPYAWRTVATLDVNSALHTEFSTAPFYWVRYTYSGTSTKGLAWLMTNQKSTEAAAAFQTALLTDIQDNDTFHDSVFKNFDGISVFKTKNDTDEPLSVFTNQSGEVSHFELQASNRNSVFRKYASGQGHISAFVNEAGDTSIYDRLEQIENSNGNILSKISFINDRQTSVAEKLFYGYSDITFSGLTTQIANAWQNADGIINVSFSTAFNTIDLTTTFYAIVQFTHF